MAEWLVAAFVEPGLDFDGVEADEVSPLDERDTAFVHQAAYVADGDGEVFGEGGDLSLIHI